MARERTETQRLLKLPRKSILRGLQASVDADSPSAFYAAVEMRNPSRSYWVHHADSFHSLKAVVTFALREAKSDTLARDFHAADAAKRVTELGFDVVHNGSIADG